VQFDVALHGLQQQISIDSVLDQAGQDVVAGGFSSSFTYLVVAKISGNGSAANTIEASIFAPGATVGNFTDASFPWMLTATSSAGFNPVITQLQFASPAGANFTVSNLYVGSAASLIAPTQTLQGDFNHDGLVDSRDYLVWRGSLGQTGPNLAADGDGDYQVDDDDYQVWRAHFGQTVSGSGSGSGLGETTAVPEPRSCWLLLAAMGAAASAAQRPFCRSKAAAKISEN